MTNNMKIDIQDKEGNEVFFGDKFKTEGGDLVTVVEDNSPENLEIDRNYDVEDAEGNRIWNAYMVITNGVKIESL